MTRRGAAATLLALALLLGSCGPRDVQTRDVLVGRWDGHVAWRDATTPIGLHVAPQADSLAVWFFAPALGVDSLFAGRLSYASPRVHFEVPDSIGLIGFDGWLRRGLVVGVFSNTALGETNPSRLPQLSLQRREARTHALPWPDSLLASPVIAHEPQRGLGAWLLARLNP